MLLVCLVSIYSLCVNGALRVVTPSTGVESRIHRAPGQLSRPPLSLAKDPRLRHLSYPQQGVQIATDQQGVFMDPHREQQLVTDPHREQPHMDPHREQQHELLVQAFLSPNDPGSEQLIWYWSYQAQRGSLQAQDMLLDARTDAGFRLALISPLASSSRAFFDKRQSYLLANNRLEKATMEWSQYKSVTVTARQERAFKSDLAHPLDDDSLISIENYFRFLRDSGTSEAKFVAISKRYNDACVAYVLRNPLHPLADKAISASVDFEKLHHQDHGTHDAQKILENFEAAKEDVLRLASRYSEFRFPIHLNIRGHQIALQDLLRVGQDRATYSATQDRAFVSVHLFKKQPSSLSSMRNEATILSKLHRLQTYDESKFLIVSQNFRGQLLSRLLSSEKNPRQIDLYKSDYKKLSESFYSATGYIHGSIRPSIVSVDSHGHLHLEEFESSFQPQDTSPPKLRDLLAKDLSAAEYEFELTILEQAAIRAGEHPRSSGSRKVILDLIGHLEKGQRWAMAHNWQAFYQRTYEI